MTTGMFILRPDGSLAPMHNREYDSEALLQSWISDHPELLAGDQISPDDPRKWLLIKREAGIPDQDNAGNRWSVDHLFIDQDGIPTLVEVKRSSDTRIRREVVGQMMDYAANAISHWPIDVIRTMFTERCHIDGVDANEEIHNKLGDDIDQDDLWIKVNNNLEDGSIRLLFVSDQIPSELLAIVEFLNKQMDRTQVLAIEIHQFTEAVNDGLVTLAPRVLGQTIESQQKKRTIPSAGRLWDEQSFFESASQRISNDEVLVLRKIYDWSISNLHRMEFGKGKVDGAFAGAYDGPNGIGAWPLWVVANGTIEFPFQHMAYHLVFSDMTKRQEFLERLLEINIFNLPVSEETLNRRPSIRASGLVDPKELDKLFAALDWFVEQLKNA